MSASNMKATRLLVSLAALSLCVFCARTTAQTQRRPRTAATPPSIVSPSPAATPDASQTATPSPSPAREVSEDEADLAIIANVTARELKFDVVPNPVVEFTGKPERTTVWEAERTNLPRPVQPGVTYRDIGIRLRIVSVFADIDRIVAEALGEVPKPEDTPTTTAPPASSPAAPPNEPRDETATTPPNGAETNTGGASPAMASRANTARVAPTRRAARPRARRLR